MRNRFEKEVEKQLKRAKVRYQYEPCRIAYILARNYIPDFTIETKSGTIYLECKGYLRPEHKSKMVAVKQQHPELDIRILFYSSNKKNIKWATKYKFPWAISVIPSEWYE